MSLQSQVLNRQFIDYKFNLNLNQMQIQAVNHQEVNRREEEEEENRLEEVVQMQIQYFQQPMRGEFDYWVKYVN